MLARVLVNLWFCTFAFSLTHSLEYSEKSDANNARSTSDSDSQSADIITGGFASFFPQNGVAGACGAVHQDSDFIGAIALQRYGNVATRSPLCGKAVQITNTNNNKSVIITVADACVTCVNSNSFDLSLGAFETISTFEDGLVPITWSFV